MKRLFSSLMRLPCQLDNPAWFKVERGVIRVAGRDASTLLNGICTRSTKEQGPVAFLSHQGRVLFDGFLHRRSAEEVFIECERKIEADVVLHIRQYKLRNNVDISSVSQEHKVVLAWSQEADGVADPRCDWNLTRCLMPTEQETAPCLPETLYHLARIAKGVPEGTMEIPRGSAVPHEYNLDLMKHIDFDKGCYLGQELVARTHYRGVVRKRIMPFVRCPASEQRKPVLADPNDIVTGIPHGSDIFEIEPADAQSVDQVRRIHADKVIGKTNTLLGNVGLAMIRLERWHAGVSYGVFRPTPGTGADTQLVVVRPFVPSWWPPLVN